jgi:hypothetical protein
MDLAKIIADLRFELQTINTAIDSLEPLARIANAGGSEPRRGNPATKPSSEEPAPVKRPRGRPRKYPLPAAPTHEAADPSDS